MSAVTLKKDSVAANVLSSSNEIKEGNLNGKKVTSKLTDFDGSKVLNEAFKSTVEELKAQGPDVSVATIREALTNSQRKAYTAIYEIDTKEEWENYFIEHFEYERPLPDEVQDFIRRRENEYSSVARKKIDTLEGERLVAELEKLEKKLEHDTFKEMNNNIERGKRTVQGWGGHGSSGSRVISSGYSQQRQLADRLKVQSRLTSKLVKKRTSQFTDFDSLYKSIVHLISSKDKDKEKAAEAMGDALIKQEEAEKQAKEVKGTSNNKRQNSKVGKKRRPSASQTKQSSQERTKETTTQGQISTKIDSMDQLQALAYELQNMESLFRLQHRVVRWKKATPDEIKTFGMRYQNPAMDLYLAKALHYLPGLEIPLSCKKIRNTFFWVTDRGFGALVRMFETKTHNLIKDGIAYIGVNELKKSVYHLFLTPRDQLPLDGQAIISGRIKSYDSEIRESPAQEKENSIEVPWTHTSDYEFKFVKNKSDKIELEITFLNEDRYIRLLPL